MSEIYIEYPKKDLIVGSHQHKRNSFALTVNKIVDFQLSVGT